MRTRPRTRKLAAALISVLLTGVAACGGGSGESSAKQLTYWSLWQKKEPQAEVLADVIADFEKDTGITVNVEWQGRDNLTKVLGALQTQDVPDLVDQQYFTLYSVLVANEQFVDLGPVYEKRIPGEGGATVRDVIPQEYDRFTTTDDGTQFMVPIEVIAYTLWYDGKELSDVSDNPPATWQDFSALLAERKADGHSPLALDAEIAGYAEYWLTVALQRALGPGGVRELVTDKDASGWDDPDVRAAVGNIAALAQDDLFIPGYKGAKWPAVQNKWAKGEADFLLMGSWAPKETAPVAADGFEYRAMNFPAMGGSEEVPSSVIGFAIPGPAEHTEEAQRFIAYLLAKDRLSGIATVAKNLTPRTDIPAPAELADVKELIDSKGLMEINDGLQADQSEFSTKVLQPNVLQLLTGEANADQFVTNLKEAQQNYWKNNG